MGVHASKEHGEEEIVPSCFAICTARLRYISRSRPCPVLLYVSMTAAICHLLGADMPKSLCNVSQVVCTPLLLRLRYQYKEVRTIHERIRIGPVHLYEEKQ
jgi:hypothetical protein